MKIQSIAMYGIKKSSFCGDRPTRNKSSDRVATVRDLNAMEKRIKAYNKALINKQNDLLGEALYNLARQNNENKYALKASQILRGGKISSEIHTDYPL